MKNLFVLLLIALVAFVGYALFWPSEFVPQPWSPPPDVTGAAAVRSAPLDTVERLVATDNPDFKPARLVHDSEVDNQQLRELEQMMAEKKGTMK